MEIIKMIDIENLQQMAVGRWFEIFSAAGIDVKENKKHGPCPLCGGKDRFRVDDKDGRGSWICNQCGAGDGLKLVDLYMNNNFKKALEFTADFLGVQHSTNYTKEDYDRNKQKSEARRTASLMKEVDNKAVQNKNAADTAVQLMSQAFPADSEHPYLLKKQIGACTAWQVDILLVIPIVNWRQELINVQKIGDFSVNRTGLIEKKFGFGGMITGCYHVIGRLVDGDPIIITEGFATGVTIYTQTNITVVVAFNSKNLLPVAESISHLYSDSKLLIAGDNDWHLPLMPKPMPNVGVQAALHASLAVGCNFTVPTTKKGVSDFNDQYVIYGESCALQIIKELKN